MLMVIAGAGASYDSIPSRMIGKSPFEAVRPPLGDDLFDAREMFESVQREVPVVMPIVPALQNRGAKESVEDVLARLAAEAERNPHRHVQLAATRYYLQAIINQCEESWYREKPVPTNMMALLDQIENARRGRSRPIFVTFNYDRMIEAALENRGQHFASLSDYVHAERTNVFKLHGSVNWARPVGEYDVNVHGGDAWTVARTVCSRIDRYQSPGDIMHWSTVPGSTILKALAIPAIAIPLRDKSAFECPADHLTALREKLKRVRAIVTIGWRGAEQHFLRLLREHALQNIDVICVGGTATDATLTTHALGEVLDRARYEAIGTGFTQFVRSRGIERLLNLAWAYE